MVESLGEWIREEQECFFDLRNFSRMLHLVFFHDASLSDVDYACVHTLIAFVCQKVDEVLVGYKRLCDLAEMDKPDLDLSLHVEVS